MKFKCQKKCASLDTCVGISFSLKWMAYLSKAGKMATLKDTEEMKWREKVHGV